VDEPGVEAGNRAASAMISFPVAHAATTFRLKCPQERKIFRSPLEFLDRVSAYLGEAQCIRSEAGEGADSRGFAASR